MSYLINRTPPARIRCLHYLLKFIYHKFGEESFMMGDLLFNENEENIHNFCDLLINDNSLGIKYCPYLQNPLSDAGCYLTRGIKDDSTKRKEISNSVNALDALNFVNRQGNKMKITKTGISFTETNFNTPEWIKMVREAICSYGLSVGLLWQIVKQGSKKIDSRGLLVGYPNTDESMKCGNQMIEISSGSQVDSNTRTKSCLLAWFATAGFITPNSLSEIKDCKEFNLKLNDYITKSNTRNEFYNVSLIPDIFNGNFLVLKPLNYNNLIKNIRALRENGQKTSRELTIKYENIIKNRRFAILYCLNFASKNKKKLNFEEFKSAIRKYKEFFVIDDKNFNEVMNIELQIAFIGGIPFQTENEYLKPLTLLANDVLCYDAPQDLLDILNEKIIKKYELSLFK